MTQKIYIVSANWYTNDEGHIHEIHLVTTDKNKAIDKMKEYTNYVRTQDLEEGWTIVDDTEGKYFSHKGCPEYYTIRIDEREVDIGITIE